jgi:hypothetical protein
MSYCVCVRKLARVSGNGFQVGLVVPMDKHDVVYKVECTPCVPKRLVLRKCRLLGCFVVSDWCYSVVC